MPAVRPRVPDVRRHAVHTLALTALVAFVAFGLAAAVSSRDSRADIDPTTAALTVRARGLGRPIAPGFVGFSLEYHTLLPYTGNDSRRVNPILVRLIRALTPGQHPVLRIGGDSTDWTWAPARGLPRPAGIKFALTRAWLRAARALADATTARLILGINFEADNALLARAEARSLIKSIGRSRITGLELGNEPELYSSFAWYRTRAGGVVYGRAPGYDLATLEHDFGHIAAALPNLPLAGPAIGGQSWIRYTSRFALAEPALRIVTVHRYPLQGCRLPAASSLHPTVDRLLSPVSSMQLANSLAGYAATAHRRDLTFRVDELNSVSCGGSRGISDTFASALWALDTLFALAHAGVDGVNIHTFAGAVYAPFSFTHAGARWLGSVAPEYYGLLMFTRAAPPGSRLLPVTGHMPSGANAWATRAKNGTTRILLLNDGSRRRVFTLRSPSASAHVKASLERLLAPSVAATHGITLGGQSFGTDTTTGLLSGRRRVAILRADEGSYAAALPGASAALLTVPGR